MRNLPKALATPCFGVVLAAALLLPGAGSAAGGSEWPSAGGNRQNTRSQESEHTLSVANVGGLQKKWELATAGDVSATPAVDADTVYVPDWAGNLYAVDRQTGRRQVDGEHPRRERRLPRQGPRHSGGDRRQGDRRHAGLGLRSGGGRVRGCSPSTSQTGALLWKHAGSMTHFAAIITQSATVFDGTVYVGVASQEEALAAFVPGYKLSFRGSMLALDLDSGAILWKTYMARAGLHGQRRLGQLAGDRHQARPGLHRHREQLFGAPAESSTAWRRPGRTLSPSRPACRRTTTSTASWRWT